MYGETHRLHRVTDRIAPVRQGQYKRIQPDRFVGLRAIGRNRIRKVGAGRNGPPKRMGVFADKGKSQPVRLQRVDYGGSDRHGTTIDTDIAKSTVDQIISVAVSLIVTRKERTAQQEQPKRNQNFIHTYILYFKFAKNSNPDLSCKNNLPTLHFSLSKTNVALSTPFQRQKQLLPS